MSRIVQLHAADNVVTCLSPLAAGTVVIAGTVEITLTAAVPFAHKIAIRPIAAAEEVIKYGEVIGRASIAIQPGDWVHTHNVESARARGDLA